jgi:hypothetical protein
VGVEALDVWYLLHVLPARPIGGDVNRACCHLKLQILNAECRAGTDKNHAIARATHAQLGVIMRSLQRYDALDCAGRIFVVGAVEQAPPVCPPQGRRERGRPVLLVVASALDERP